MKQNTAPTHSVANAQTGHTPGPWFFKRQEVFEELAKLKKQPLADHEGYFRANDGAWIISTKDAEGNTAGQVAQAAMRARAKRGEGSHTPDPEGQANARLIAEAPMMLDFIRYYAERGDQAACDIIDRIEGQKS